MFPGIKCACTNIIFFCRFVNSLVYYGLSLNTSNFGGNDYLNVFLSGAVEVPAYIFCQFGINTFLGRRMSLCGCMVIGGVALLLTLVVPSGESIKISMWSCKGGPTSGCKPNVALEPCYICLLSVVESGLLQLMSLATSTFRCPKCPSAFYVFLKGRFHIKL